MGWRDLWAWRHDWGHPYIYIVSLLLWLQMLSVVFAVVYTHPYLLCHYGMLYYHGMLYHYGTYPSSNLTDRKSVV